MRKTKIFIICLISIVLIASLGIVLFKRHKQKQENFYFSKEQIIKERKEIKDFLKSLSE